MHVETDRLVLRRPILADVPALFEFLGDAAAMEYTHVDASVRECRRRIAAHERRRRRDGYAPWTVVIRADARIVGWRGLYNDPFQPGWGVEVGYFLHPAAWGCGFATELMSACTDIADHALELHEVRAFARPENVRSRRVLEKAGLGWSNLFRRWRGSCTGAGARVPPRRNDLSRDMCSFDVPSAAGDPLRRPPRCCCHSIVGI
jgi:RimJ/RimL family protein N-acetyltransferase